MTKYVVIAVDAQERTLDALTLGRALTESMGAPAKLVAVFTHLPFADPAAPEMVRDRRRLMPHYNAHAQPLLSHDQRCVRRYQRVKGALRAGGALIHFRADRVANAEAIALPRRLCFDAWASPEGHTAASLSRGPVRQDGSPAPLIARPAGCDGGRRHQPDGSV